MKQPLQIRSNTDNWKKSLDFSNNVARNVRIEWYDRDKVEFTREEKFWFVVVTSGKASLGFYTEMGGVLE